MAISRRGIFGGAASLSAAMPLAAGAAAPVSVALPDRVNFKIDHTYLNAAYAHPMGQMTYAAMEDYLQRRMRQVDTPWPGENDRNRAVEAFARLINADPADIAVVPSTMEGENLIVEALGLDEGAGVVTDAFHYSPEIYGELRRRGVPVATVMPRANRIELADIDQAISAKTKLVAVSAISSDTSFHHDLKPLCDVAHRKGALVYADIIQMAGAVPLDVKESGVDFCCCGAYKWIMGDFGVAFLYVRPDRLKDLKRILVGWRQYKAHTSHVYPMDPPGATSIDYELAGTTAGLFEVSTPDWGALSGLVASLAYVQALGVEQIGRHRAPMMERLQAELPRYGFGPLTPKTFNSPAASFSYPDAADKLGPALTAARVKISLYKNRIRISPSVYNDMGDIDRLMAVLSRA